MPSIESFERNQNAVLWRKTATNRYGEPTLDDPEELEVRWEWQWDQALGPLTKPVGMVATVTTVEDDVTLGSLMWLGTLEDWYDVGSGGDNSRLMEVVSYAEIPDLKGREVERILGLVRYKDSP